MRSSTAGSWNHHQWEVMRADIANLLAELLNEEARKDRLGRAFVELLFLIDVDQNLKRRPDLAFVSVGAVAVPQARARRRSLGDGP